MSYVVAGTCFGCKCGSCAQMCPVDAFREGEMMLFIDPEKCINCDACRSQCGRGAIFPAEELEIDHLREIRTANVAVVSSFRPHAGLDLRGFTLCTGYVPPASSLRMLYVTTRVESV